MGTVVTSRLSAKKRLIEADDVGAAFGGIDLSGDLCGGGVRLSIGADSDPVAGGALESDDVGAGVFALEFLLEVAGFALMMEDADLDAPSSPLRNRGWIAEHVDADAGGASSPDADLDGGGSRQIQNAAGNEGSAICDGDDDRLAIGEIRDADEGAHGQGAMGSGHAVLVVDLAIGFAGVVVGRAVPAGNSYLTVKDRAAGLRSALWEGSGRSLLRRRRWGCGSLDVAMTATGDGEAKSECSREKECGAHSLHVVGMRELERGMANARFLSDCCRATYSFSFTSNAQSTGSTPPALDNRDLTPRAVETASN